MSKEERKLKAKVDEYFEKYWSVSFEKFIENWEETSEALEYKDKEIERLNNIIETFEEELERESNMKEEYTCLEHNTFIDIKNTLKSVLKRFQELKGSESNE